ncbi:MAG: hypothetical protein JJU06_12690 [Ectothiorhodospiraceae bacterium]|nr:hypothetical protein [Ectothiorhodospiraceae bacterium]
MEGNTLAVRHLGGSGPYWEYELDGATLTIDGESVDLEALQKRARVAHDFMCEDGRYKATVIVPPVAYELPEDDGDDEEEGESEPPERLPLKVEDVELRLYPRKDKETA